MRAPGQPIDEAYLGAVLFATVLDNRWIPLDHREKQKDGTGLTQKQAQFLVQPQREVFYGGAAGGGKSDALLMAGLQYVDVPGYAGVIFRRTYKDLAKPNAIMDRAYQWLHSSGARWTNETKTWSFPNVAGPPAKLTFSHMEHDKDKYEHQSAEYQFIGWDELTQFLEGMYTWMFSRLRRVKGFDVPLRVRSASNPGGIGHAWVKSRFIVYGWENGRVFIKALLRDNPNIDQDEYVASLGITDPITRARYLEGDWDVVEGGKFSREWFEIVLAAPPDLLNLRYWDLAGTSPGEGEDPDYTAGAKVGKRNDGIFYISDMRHAQISPHQVERLVLQTAMLDGPEVEVVMEQEPGQSGKAQIDHYRRNILQGFRYRGWKTTGNKELRINVLSGDAQAGKVKLVKGRWNSGFLDEAEAYLGTLRSGHDDQLDAAAGGIEQLNRRVYRRPTADSELFVPQTSEELQVARFWDGQDLSGKRSGYRKKLDEFGKRINHLTQATHRRTRGTANW